MGASGGTVTNLRVRNGRTAPMTLCLEPWGEIYTVGPGAAVEVVAHGPEGDRLEVEHGADQVTIYGWPGSTVSLFQDGVELGAGSGERGAVPGVPAKAR
jgi:hypothetical protein